MIVLTPGVNRIRTQCLALLTLLLAVIDPTRAAATVIEWASTLSNSTVASAGNALGQPDGVITGSYSGTATFGGFGLGSTVDYGSLAVLLNVTPTLLSQADFISVEHNGNSGGTFETSTWIFSDGTNSLTRHHNVGDSPSGAVIALNNITNESYDNFFGITSPFNDGDWACILFDIDGVSSVNPFSPNFTVKMSALGIGTQPNSPEADVMGRMIPEPSTLTLAALGLAGGLLRWRRGSHRRVH